MFSTRPFSFAWSLVSSSHNQHVSPNVLFTLSQLTTTTTTTNANCQTTKFGGARFFGMTSLAHDSTKSEKLVIVGLGNIGKQYDGTRHNIGFACVDDIAAKYKLSFVSAPRLHCMVAEGKIECTVEVRHREPKERKQQREKRRDKKDKKEATKDTTTKDATKTDLAKDATKDTTKNTTQATEDATEDIPTNTEDTTTNTKDTTNLIVEKVEIPRPPPPPPTYIKVTKHLILVKPTTLMNLSGSAVSAVLRQYQVPLSSALVIMDDLDLDAGRVLVKRGGGSTQRGIEDIVRAMRTQDFLRVRFGISQPPGGAADKAKFVLSKFSRSEMEEVRDGVRRVSDAVKVWLEKGEAHAMNVINKR